MPCKVAKDANFSTMDGGLFAWQKNHPTLHSKGAEEEEEEEEEEEGISIRSYAALPLSFRNVYPMGTDKEGERGTNKTEESTTHQLILTMN